MFKFFRKNEVNTISDDEIVSMANGKMIDICKVSDPVFANQIMGKSVAFSFSQDKVILHSPINGTLSVLFPTGHAFGITGKNGMEILVHIGIDTVNAKGNGFKLLSKKQGDKVNALDPIVEIDMKKLSAQFDMSTILIVTDSNGKEIDFINPQQVEKGQSLLKK